MIASEKGVCCKL